MLAGRQVECRLASDCPHSAMASTESIVGFMRLSRLAPFEPDQLWQLAREPIFWLDPTLKLIWVNRAWEKLTGYPAESVVGLTCQAHGPTGRAIWPIWPRAFIRRPKSLTGQPAGTLSLIFHAERRGDLAPPRVLAVPRRTRILDRAPGAGAPGRMAPPSVRRLASQPAPRRAARDQAAAPGAIRVRQLGRVSVRRTGGCSTRCVWPPRRRLRYSSWANRVRASGRSREPFIKTGRGDSSRWSPSIARRCRPRSWSANCSASIENARSSRGTVTAAAGEHARPRLSLGDGSTLLIREILMLPRDLQERLAASLDAPVRLLATTALDPDERLGERTASARALFRPDDLGDSGSSPCASAATSCRCWRSTSSSEPISVEANREPGSHPRRSRP